MSIDDKLNDLLYEFTLECEEFGISIENGNYEKWLAQNVIELRNKLNEQKVKQVQDAVVEKLNSEPKLVVAEFLRNMSSKHNEELNEVIVGFQYGNLSVQRYNEGEYQKFKTLEEIDV